MSEGLVSIGKEVEIGYVVSGILKMAERIE